VGSPRVMCVYDPPLPPALQSQVIPWLSPAEANEHHTAILNLQSCVWTFIRCMILINTNTSEI
jgi:hypothetical protein